METTSADGAVGASGTGQALVTRAVDQRAHHMLEHGPVGDSAAVAAERVPAANSGRVGRSAAKWPRRSSGRQDGSAARLTFVITERRELHDHVDRARSAARATSKPPADHGAPILRFPAQEQE